METTTTKELPKRVARALEYLTDQDVVERQRRNAECLLGRGAR